MYIVTITKKVIKLNLTLLLLLLSSNCDCKKSEKKNNPIPQNESKIINQPSEVIVFIGNPGVGKSTLCNSVFQQAIFNSGISIGTGMTEKNKNTSMRTNYILIHQG